jgi:hypothetical protein
MTSSSWWRQHAPWLIVLALTGSLTALTTWQALERYRTFGSGWSWDLAYYNQWFWSLTKGSQVLTVRPIASYADEGPSVWKMNYLAPVRFLIIPIYAVFPGPRTLLVIQNLVFWWVVPAAYTLVRSESGSKWIGVSAGVLVPATPLAWPLVWNDFRELQLAAPFVLWAIQGYRSRNAPLTTAGVLGMLCCRQEFAIVVASLAILPARQPEDLGRSYRWARAVFAAGLVWLIWGFFGYLRFMVSSNGPELYMEQFEGPKASLFETAATASDFLLVGMGSWVLLACFAPRMALLALPWVWSLSNGKWALRLIGTQEWHHVRYTAPMFDLVLAAGLVGYGRFAAWFAARGRRGALGLGIFWCLVAAGLLVPSYLLERRFARVPHPIGASEGTVIWKAMAEVEPRDGVVAVYEVSAPLSSRARLFSYVLEQNKPKGYPANLEEEIRWVFLKRGDLNPEVLTRQRFTLVHRGDFLEIYRRLSR